MTKKEKEFVEIFDAWAREQFKQVDGRKVPVSDLSKMLETIDMSIVN